MHVCSRSPCPQLPGDPCLTFCRHAMLIAVVLMLRTQRGLLPACWAGEEQGRYDTRNMQRTGRITTILFLDLALRCKLQTAQGYHSSSLMAFFLCLVTLEGSRLSSLVLSWRPRHLVGTVPLLQARCWNRVHSTCTAYPYPSLSLTAWVQHFLFPHERAQRPCYWTDLLFY